MVTASIPSGTRLGVALGSGVSVGGSMVFVGRGISVAVNVVATDFAWVDENIGVNVFVGMVECDVGFVD